MNRFKTKLFKYAKKLSIIALLAITFAVICNSIIIYNAEGKTFSKTENIPKNKVGLVLGAGKYLKNGRINLYYKYRIDATVKLYKTGKIDFVLASGDNGIEAYDEPTTFKEDLIARGIPEHKIFLDYAGFRTLDSVIRAKEIFSLTQCTIISQKFHNERAIYLAKKNGINAIAFNAKDITGRYGLKTNLREYLAKTKAVLDVVFNVQPKFLGKKIEIK
ncbi:vancomycin high temperature exclusion protein [Lacinutrix sp. Bg11-31]|uniref:SanA/YdcF family protein n=1 Tax=Lacinutrix sp. Bg11-31 TaxID=2057808 RepID=UPI000C31142B|nr:ElyC/SanA/YdcF family protein [Lacinutrix sp. Bg11-31]AUC83618.1 protein SanA [Lacinutrix sp. Bg11-31]